MNLTLDQIKEITSGAVKIEYTDDGIKFHRFTEQQEELYLERNKEYYKRTFATAGIKLSFKTNSEKLFIKGTVFKASSRQFYSIDVFADKRHIGSIDNYSDIKLERNYTEMECEMGEFSKEFMLGMGTKTVVVYLPWSVGVNLKELILDENSFLEPVKYSKKLLAFGDSITQGHDALRSFNRYTSLLCDKLDSEEYNKGIGGEIIFPELAKIKEAFVPDYITVAYGTNDFSRLEKEEFKRNCKEFYKILSESYPTSKIFAITPIWRKDLHEETKFGKFSEVGECISEAVAGLKNVTLISGYGFVPESEDYFADLRIHPNDMGFERYFSNLYNEIKKHLM